VVQLLIQDALLVEFAVLILKISWLDVFQIGDELDMYWKHWSASISAKIPKLVECDS